MDMHFSRKILSTISFLSLLVVLSAPVVRGADIEGAGTTSKVLFRTVASLSDLAVDLKHVKGESRKIYDEVTRPPINPQAPLDIVGPMEITKPLKVSERSLLEPRDTVIEASLKSGKTILIQLNADLDSVKDALKILSDRHNRYDALIDEIGSLESDFELLERDQKLLRKLITASPVDNVQLAGIASRMHKTAGKMDRVRKKILRTLRILGRKSEKAEKRSGNIIQAADRN